jgi:hypothetical protein
MAPSIARTPPTRSRAAVLLKNIALLLRHRVSWVTLPNFFPEPNLRPRHLSAAEIKAIGYPDLPYCLAVNRNARAPGVTREGLMRNTAIPERF